MKEPRRIDVYKDRLIVSTEPGTTSEERSLMGDWIVRELEESGWEEEMVILFREAEPELVSEERDPPEE